MLKQQVCILTTAYLAHTVRYIYVCVMSLTTNDDLTFTTKLLILTCSRRRRN